MPAFLSLHELGVLHPDVFCAAVLLLNLTPGPDTAFIVGQSVAYGPRAGLASVLGISCGCVAHTLALAIGLGAVLSASAGAFLVVKVLGALYLVFLGVRLIAASFGPAASRDGGAPTAMSAGRGGLVRVAATIPPARRIFVQGLLTNLLNPKVVLFFLSFFPQFVSGDSPSKAQAFVGLGAMLVAISTVYNGIVAWLAGGIARRVRTAPRVKAWLDRSIGAAFVGLGARIGFGDR